MNEFRPYRFPDHLRDLCRAGETLKNGNHNAEDSSWAKWKPRWCSPSHSARRGHTSRNCCTKDWDSSSFFPFPFLPNVIVKLWWPIECGWASEHNRGMTGRVHPEMHRDIISSAQWEVLVLSEKPQPVKNCNSLKPHLLLLFFFFFYHWIASNFIFSTSRPPILQLLLKDCWKSYVTSNSCMAPK